MAKTIRIQKISSLQSRLEIKKMKKTNVIGIIAAIMFATILCAGISMGISNETEYGQCMSYCTAHINDGASMMQKWINPVHRCMPVCGGIWGAE